MASDKTPGLLSTADALLLRQLGLSTIRAVLGILLEGIFFGAYSILFGLAVYSFRQTGIRSLKAIFMSAAVGYLYLSSLTAFAMDCYIAFNNIHSYFMLGSLPLEDRPEVAEATFRKVISVVEWFFVSNAIVADSVVVWRTWAVYQGWLPAMLAPYFLLFAACVFSLMDVALTIHISSTGGLLFPVPNAWKVYTTAQILVWALSLATNVLCTVLIGFRAWKFRKETIDLRLGVQQYPGMSNVDILTVLVESGFIYSILWAIQIIGYLNFSTTTGVIIAHIVVRIGRQISGMYPTIIIVLVNFRRTIWEGYVDDLSLSTVPGSLRWVHSGRRTGGASELSEGVIRLDPVRREDADQARRRSKASCEDGNKEMG